MLIILILVIIFLSCLFFAKFDYDSTPNAITLISGFILVIALVLLVASQSEVSGKLSSIQEARRSINEQRADTSLSLIDKQQLSKIIVETNQELAQLKYWAANPWTSWFVPHRVLNIKPLK